MKLNAKVAEALNAQINSEWNAAYTYLAMGAWFDTQDLPGFAQWFRAHATEEMTHADRIYQFVVARDAEVEYFAMGKPKNDYGSAVEVLEAALNHERGVTEQIHALFHLAQAENEHSTQSMLNWFLDEQVQEEDLFRTVLRQVEAASDSPWNMLLLDKELAGSAGTGAEEAAATPQ